MNRVFSSLIIVLFLAGAASCTNGQLLQNEAYPVIYTNSWTSVMTATIGKELVLSPSVSPAKAKITWLLDDVVIGTEAELRWIPETSGTFTLTLLVEYNGQKTLRTTLLTVQEEIVVPDPDDPGNPDDPGTNPDDPQEDTTAFKPDAFTPKNMSSTVFGFFDAEEGDTTKIAWDAISHLIVTTASFNDTDKPHYPYSLKDMRSLVNTAHHHGVYIILQYSGNHNHRTSVQTYGSTLFYDRACKPDTRANTIKEITEYADANALDGIHIWMDKPTSSDDGYSDENALASFYNDLHAAKPAHSKTGGNFYMSIGTIPSQYVTKGVQDKLVPLPGWDFIFTMVMCIEATSNTSHAPQDVVKSELSYWHGKGVDKSKLVVTIPAVLWCVDASSVGGTSALNYSNISSCSTYLPFSDLFKLVSDDVTAATSRNNYTNIANYDWIRYDGFPWVNTKLGYLNTPGAGAVALWKINYDGDAEGSMLGFIKKTLSY